MRGTTIGRWLLRGLAIGAALLAPLPYVDVAGPLPGIQAGTPIAGVASLAVAGWLAWRRDWWPSALSLVAAGLLAGPVVLPPARPDPGGVGTIGAAAASAGPSGGVFAGTSEFRLMSLNVEFGRADPNAVVALTIDRRIDVLILTEMTPGGWRRLEDAGLRRRFPNATGRTDTGASGTVILSRLPFTCVDTVEGSPCGQVVTRPPDAPSYRLGDAAATFDLPSVRLADGTVVRGVHTRPPSFLRNDRWQREQHDLRAWVDGLPAGARVVLAGDYNASPSHPAFRRLADGLARAPHTGFPWTRTWPEGARVPALIQIDHILSRGFAVLEEGVDVVPNTDHAAVWAQLRAVSR